MVTEQQLRDAIKQSFSYREVARKINSNARIIQRRIKKFSIDISHFTGQGHLKGKKNLSCPPAKPLSEIMVMNSTYVSTYKLKNRMLKEGLIEYKCSICNINNWQGKQLQLHMDHINGINNDHRAENLQLLCPNCHSQTPTYCGKNKKLKNEQKAKL